MIYMLGLFLRCLFCWRVSRGDVAISQGVLYTLPMLPLKRKGARMVTVVHGAYFEELVRRSIPRFVRALLFPVYEPMYHASDLLLPVSGELAGRLRERHHVCPDRICRAHNSAPDIPATPSAELDRLRGELGIPATAVTLVFAGGLNPIKRVDRFVRLVRDLGADYTVKGLVVGDGPEREHLEALAEELGVRDGIVFTGWVSSATPYIELADVLILCSDYEGCPTVLLEGLALCRPMVGSRVGGIPEILADERLTFDPGEPAALTETVRGILSPDGRPAEWIGPHLAAQRERFRTPWEDQVIDAAGPHS